MSAPINIDQIIQQPHAENTAEETPYLGFFADEKREEYWHIEANRAGLRKYAVDLLTASVYTPDSDNDSPDAPLESAWLDEAGYAQPLFVRFVSGPSPALPAPATPFTDKLWTTGCGILFIALIGIFIAGIKEVVDIITS